VYGHLWKWICQVTVHTYIFCGILWHSTSTPFFLNSSSHSFLSSPSLASHIALFTFNHDCPHYSLPYSRIGTRHNRSDGYCSSAPGTTIVKILFMNVEETWYAWLALVLTVHLCREYLVSSSLSMYPASKISNECLWGLCQHLVPWYAYLSLVLTVRLCRGYFVSSSLSVYPARKIPIECLCWSLSTSIALIRIIVLGTNCSPLSWILCVLISFYVSSG